MNEAFVYMWVDITTGKRYIGCHKGDTLDGYVCSSKPMLRDYTQRPQDFQRTLIEFGTWKDMLAKEQSLIAECNAVRDPMFYNQSNNIGPYAVDQTGMKRTKETRGRLSEAQKGKTRSKESKDKQSAAQMGRVVSEETRGRLSEALKGKPKSEETRARMAAAKIGNSNSLGHKHTEETKTKISAIKMGKKLSKTRCDKGRKRAPYKIIPNP